MKKLFAVMLTLVMILSVLPVLADEYTPAEPKTDADAKEYAGEWVCHYAIVNKEMINADENPEPLGINTAFTMKITENSVVVAGMKELGTDPLPLVFVDGTYCFEPEEGVRVFTLRLLEDGNFSLTFDMMELSPVFFFFPAAGE